MNKKSTDCRVSLSRHHIHRQPSKRAGAKRTARVPSILIRRPSRRLLALKRKHPFLGPRSGSYSACRAARLPRRRIAGRRSGGLSPLLLPNGERLQPAPPLLRAGPRLLRLRRRRPRRLHHAVLHPRHRLLLRPVHPLRRRLLPRHPALPPVLAAAPPPPHLVPLPARAPDALLRRAHRLLPRRPPPPPQGHPLPPLRRPTPPPARPLLGPHRRQVCRLVTGAHLRVLLRRRRRRAGRPGGRRPRRRVRQDQVRGPDPQGPLPPRVARRPRRGGAQRHAHRAGPLRRGRAGARGQRRLRHHLRRRGALGQRRRQARRARAPPPLELQGQPDGLRRRRARRRPLGPPRLVVPGHARLRRRHAARQERAREPPLARGGGHRAGLRARRAGLQVTALIHLDFFFLLQRSNAAAY